MRLYLALIAFLIFCFAYISHAAESSFEQYLSRGKAAIDRQNYDAAISEISLAVKERPGDAQAALYLGVAYSRAGKFREAETWLKEALRADPLSGRANLELGILYEKKGLHTESRDFLEAGEELSPGIPVTLKARETPAEEKKQPVTERKKNWSLDLTTAIQYDTNVVLVPDGGPLPEGITGEDDWRFFAYLNAGYLYPVTGRFRVGPVFSLYQSLHSRINEFNTMQFRPGLELVYLAGKRVSVRLDYAFEDTTVGGDLYLLSHNISPQLIVDEGNGFFGSVMYRYQTKDFHDSDLFATNSDRNGDNHMLKLSQFIPLTRPVSLSLSYAFDRDSADVEYWSYNGHQGYVGVNAKIGETWKLDLAGEYYRKDYRDDYPGTTKKRNDNTTTLSASISTRIFRSSSIQWEVIAGYLYSNNSSNLDEFDYKREIISLMLRMAL